MPQNNNYFRTICRISRALGTTLSEEKLLSMIVQSAIDTMQTKASLLFLFDEELSFSSARSRKVREAST